MILRLLPLRFETIAALLIFSLLLTEIKAIRVNLHSPLLIIASKQTIIKHFFLPALQAFGVNRKMKENDLRFTIYDLRAFRMPRTSINRTAPADFAARHVRSLKKFPTICSTLFLPSLHGNADKQIVNAVFARDERIRFLSLRTDCAISTAPKDGACRAILERPI